MATPTRPVPQRPRDVPNPASPTTNTSSNPLAQAPVFEGEKQPSIIHPQMNGLVFVTGYRGKGKTVFGCSMDHPDNIVLIDCETKGATIATPLGLKAYFPVLSEVASVHGDEYHTSFIWERVMTIVRAIPLNRYTTLVLDNAAYIQDGAAQLLRSNPTKAAKYGIEAKNLITGGYGGPWPGVKHMINGLFKLAHSKGIKVIVATFQLTGAWKDGKPLLGKFKSTDVSIWHEQSILTLGLVDPHPKYSPKPRGLVLKESLPESKWDDELKKPIHIRKLPYAVPECEPWRIYEYLRVPADLNNPAEGEEVTAAEIDPFKPTFGKEQLALLERLSRIQKDLYGDDGEDEEEVKPT